MVKTAIDEVCRLLTERYESEMRSRGVDEDFIKKHKTYHAHTFKECTIHRVGFITLLKELAKKPCTKETIMQLVKENVIIEDPLLIPDYLERFKDILFEEQNGTYKLTPLGYGVLKELTRRR